MLFGVIRCGELESGSVSLGPQWLLGNRYTRISSKWGSQMVLRGGDSNPESVSLKNLLVGQELMQIEVAENDPLFLIERAT